MTIENTALQSKLNRKLQTLAREHTIFKRKEISSP